MSYSFRVALHDTDAAGVVFFGHLFRHLHDAFEHWMDQLGYPVDQLIRGGEILLPLTHAEADYRAPMRHGDRIVIELALSQLGDTYFALGYHCLRLDEDREYTNGGKLAATALTRHCCIDPECHQSRPLPDSLAQALRLHLPAQE